MAKSTVSSVTVKDSTGTTKTMTEVTDPSNSDALAPKVFVDDALNPSSIYSTGASQITAAATPGVVVEIKGSATKTVRIKKVIFQMNATTAKQWPVTFQRAVAAVEDGTAVVPKITKLDTSDAAATAVVSHFTANPTAKAANPTDSVVFIQDVTATAPATAAAPLVWEPVANGGKPFTLRGAADCLVIRLGGGGLTAGEKYSYSVVWAEDDN